MQIERDHLPERNGDMGVTVDDLLDNGGDADLEMDENGDVTSKLIWKV